MARTSEFNPDDLEGEIGARGATRVNSENRRAVQNWCIASGVASIYTKSLTVGTLDAIYNDTSNRELVKARAEAGKPQPEPTGPVLSGLPLPPANTKPRTDWSGTPIPAPAPKETPPMAQTPTPPVSTIGTDADRRAQQIAEAMRLMAAATAPAAVEAPKLDEERVIELVKLHSAKPDHVTITVQSATPREPVTLADTPRHALFPRVLRAIGAALNVLIVGPAGSGKTTIAEQVAEALALPFYMTGAVDSPYKLLGFRDAQGRYEPTAFRRAFADGGVFLFDEMDASSPSALLAFNAALANGYADFPDGMVKRHADFRVIAAANTYGAGRDRQYVGRNQLDAASRDRFVTLPMDYDANLERLLAGPDQLAGAWCALVQAARAASRTLKIQHVISPRATLQGAALLAAGESLDDTIDATLWRGLEKEQADKIAAQCREARDAVDQIIRDRARSATKKAA